MGIIPCVAFPFLALDEEFPVADAVKIRKGRFSGAKIAMGAADSPAAVAATITCGCSSHRFRMGATVGFAGLVVVASVSQNRESSSFALQV